MSIEPEILQGRQAFADAQEAFDRATDFEWPVRVAIGWYGTSVNPERGSFALVQADGVLDSLVGDYVRVRYGRRAVNAYVIGRSADLVTPIALTRRTYMALALLAPGPALARLEVLT